MPQEARATTRHSDCKDIALHLHLKPCSGDLSNHVPDRAQGSSQNKKEGIMSTATWIRNELNQHGISYEETQHPDAFTAQEVAHQEHMSGHRVAKVVCVMADGWPYELILPASRRVMLDWVRDLLGAREVRLATEEELERYFPDCELGALPALRYWEGVEVIADGHLNRGGEVLILGGTHRDSVRMNLDDWFDLVNPRVELISEPDAGRQPMPTEPSS